MGGKTAILHCLIIGVFSLAFIVDCKATRFDLKSAVLSNEVYPTLRRVTNFFRDLKFRVRGTTKPKENIVIVDIDSKSVARVGPWPWRRDHVARLIENTFATGARVVGLDMMFADPQVPIPEEIREVLLHNRLGGFLGAYNFDGALVSTLFKHSDRIVLGWESDSLCRPAYSDPKVCSVRQPALAKTFKDMNKFAFSRQKFEIPIRIDKTPLLSAPTLWPNMPLVNHVIRHAGTLNTMREPDGIVRRSSLVVLVNGVPQPSFALELARVALGDDLEIEVNKSLTVEAIRMAKSRIEIPVYRSGLVDINYRGPRGAFTTISAIDVLQGGEDAAGTRQLAGNLKPILKDSVAIIGISHSVNSSPFTTPFDEGVSRAEIHATILDNILSREFISSPPLVTGLVVTLLLMMVGGAVLAMFSQHLVGYRTISLFVLVFLALLFADTQSFRRYHWDCNTGLLYLELITLVLVAFGARILHEERKRNFVRAAFSKYVSPIVVDSIIKHPETLALGATKRKLTVLFADIRDFVSYSESIDVRLLSEFLNDYFSMMTQIIFAQSGTIDKFVGDAIMAFWGAPLDEPRHAELACQTALKMALAVDERHSYFKEKYGIDVRIGIGITTSTVSVGNMGAENMFNYTALGDGVNLASRLEGASKLYGAPIVTTEDTLDEIRSLSGTIPPHLAIGELRVKGREKAVSVFQIFPHPPDPDMIKYFEEGKNLYLKRDWSSALKKFLLAEGLIRNSAPPLKTDVIGAYISRCQIYLNRAPGPEWDGSWYLEKQ